MTKALLFILLLPLASCSQQGFFSITDRAKHYAHMGNVCIGIQGQSNGSGLSPRSYLWTGAGSFLYPSVTRAFTRVLIWNHAHLAFEPLQIGAVSFNGTGGGNAINEVNTGAGYEDGFGPEIGFAQRFMYETSEDDTAFIIKYCIGGSSIENWTAPGGGYESIYKDYYDEAMPVLNVRHPGLTMDYMLFEQGEANAGNTQAQYFTKDSTKILQLRSRYVGSTGKIVQVLKSGATGVAAAQIQAASFFSDVYYYDSRSYLKLADWDPAHSPYNGDHTHYHPLEQLHSGGRDFFNLIFNTTGTITGL